jgi:tetratricopeptide (TPR) repeat protein
LRRILAHPLAVAVLATGLSTAALAAAEPDPGPPSPEQLWAESVSPGPARPAALEPRSDVIDQAWRTPAATLEGRVSATRRAALGVGIWSLDPAARAIAQGANVGADPTERAQAAVRLAPDLPAPRMDLARSIWLHKESPISAVRAVGEALHAASRHLEASVWVAGCALFILALTLVGGALISIVASAGLALPHASHDLGDLVSCAMPGFARVAFVGAVLLAPLALGEGILGLVLALFAISVVYGSRRHRLVMILAAAALVAGAYPAARWAGSVLGAFATDPTAEAAYAVAGGSSLPSHLARLASDPDDPLSARALALHARRSGNLGVADARYQKLREEDPGDYVIANNAADIRLGLGHMETALDLYAEAVALNESPVVLYNLSQAYGRAFQVENLAVTLQRAQELDGALLAELTELQGADPEGFVVDLPLPSEPMWRRIAQGRGGEQIAAELRAPIAPGRLGGNVWVASAAFAGVGMLALLLGGRFRHSAWCPRCGRRVCPRCEPEYSGGELCGGCNRLFYQPETTDRALRLERVTALRRRERRVERAAWAASLGIPGVAGLLADRPLRSLLASMAFALAVFALVWRAGVVPDPLVMGAAAPVLFTSVAVLSALAYAVLVALSLATRRRG